MQAYIVFDNVNEVWLDSAALRPAQVEHVILVSSVRREKRFNFQLESAKCITKIYILRVKTFLQGRRYIQSQKSSTVSHIFWWLICYAIKTLQMQGTTKVLYYVIRNIGNDETNQHS